MRINDLFFYSGSLQVKSFRVHDHSLNSSRDATRQADVGIWLEAAAGRALHAHILLEIEQRKFSSTIYATVDSAVVEGQIQRAFLDIFIL